MKKSAIKLIPVTWAIHCQWIVLTVRYNFFFAFFFSYTDGDIPVDFVTDLYLW